MTTYKYCKVCHKLFNKELGCDTCHESHEPNETTLAALEESMGL